MARRSAPLFLSRNQIQKKEGSEREKRRHVFRSSLLTLQQNKEIAVKRLVVMFSLLVALVLIVGAVPAMANCCCAPCNGDCSPCLEPKPATLCEKLGNTVVQPIGFAADVLTFHWIRAGKRVVGTAINVATLPFDVVANTPCGCGCGINDFAPKVECPTLCCAPCCQ